MIRRTPLYKTFSKFCDISINLHRETKKLLSVFNSDDGNMKEIYDLSLNIVEITEKMVSIARVLPAYTGNPQAKEDVEQIIKKNFPVGIGFTKQGWFSVRIPVLLPKKENGSAEYIRSSLYPAMMEFFSNRNPVRFSNCVLIFRHVYSKDRKDRRKRDHDNIEVNVVSDIIALYVMLDDAPTVCNHYYCSAEGTTDRTEVYVVPNSEFSKWINAEKKFPRKGEKLYEMSNISSKKEV